MDAATDIANLEIHRITHIVTVNIDLAIYLLDSVMIKYHFGEAKFHIISHNDESQSQYISVLCEKLMVEM